MMTGSNETMIPTRPVGGYDYGEGRSRRMIQAEVEGKITIGRWAKRHGVSVRAAVEVMALTEAHHTGTGRRGRTRLTYVIEADAEPTTEQLEAMQAWNRGDRPTVRGWHIKWEREYGAWGRRHNIATLGLFCGDPNDAPKNLHRIDDDAEWAEVQASTGRRLRAYATSWRELYDE